MQIFAENLLRLFSAKFNMKPINETRIPSVEMREVVHLTRAISARNVETKIEPHYKVLAFLVLIIFLNQSKQSFGKKSLAEDRNSSVTVVKGVTDLN